LLALARCGARGAPPVKPPVTIGQRFAVGAAGIVAPFRF